MKNATMTQKMRWIAGGLYGAFFLYQMLMMKYVASMMGLYEISLVFCAEVFLGMLAGGFCCWLFFGKTEVKEGVRRAVVAATVLVVLYELLFYTAQVNAVYYTLLTSFPFTAFTTEANLGIVQMVVIMIRLMLLILAVFFVTSAREDVEADDVEEDEEEDESDEDEEGEDDEADEDEPDEDDSDEDEAAGEDDDEVSEEEQETDDEQPEDSEDEPDKEEETEDEPDEKEKK